MRYVLAMLAVLFASPALAQSTTHCMSNKDVAEGIAALIAQGVRGTMTRETAEIAGIKAALEADTPGMPYHPELTRAALLVNFEAGTGMILLMSEQVTCVVLTGPASKLKALYEKGVGREVLRDAVRS